MKSVIALVLTFGFALSLYAGDASVYLDSTNGGSSMVVYDAQTTELVRVQSDGLMEAANDMVVAGQLTANSFAGNGSLLTNLMTTLQTAYDNTPWYNNPQSANPAESNLVNKFGVGTFIDVTGTQIKFARAKTAGGNNGSAISAVVDDPVPGYGAMSASVQGNTNALATPGEEVCAIEAKLDEGANEWLALLGVKLNTGYGILQAGASGITADKGELGALGATFGGNDYAGFFVGNVLVQGAVAASSMSVGGNPVLTSYSETDPVWEEEKGGYLPVNGDGNQITNLSGTAIQTQTVAPTAIANTALVQTTTFTGDIAGTFDNFQIQASAVGTPEIADTAVTPDKLDRGYWAILGNANTTDGYHFIGTTDNTPLNFQVNSRRVLRIEPDTDSPRLIAGYEGNTASGIGSVVGGGGSVGMENHASADYAMVAGGHGNVAAANYAMVGGGWSNTASGWASMVGGGANNLATGSVAVVAGGWQNSALGKDSSVGGGSVNVASGFRSVVGGGSLNAADGDYSAVGGGDENQASATNSTIAGGHGNVAGADYAVVAGGTMNTATGFAASIGGGWSNTASSWSSTIGGGFNNTAGDGPTTVGGGGNNAATKGSAVVAGGWQNEALGQDAAIGGGVFNTASGPKSVIAGGETNQASGDYSAVGGGDENQASATNSTIAGGHANVAGANYAIVGGGSSNTASGWASMVGGGANNLATGSVAVVAGGWQNSALGNDSSVGGGAFNVASGFRSVVGGGSLNTAGGENSTVPGGYSNSAIGIASFAAGTHARANHNGVFIWSDTNDTDFVSTADNQFLIRASGNVGINTDSPSQTLEVAGNVKANAYYLSTNAWLQLDASGTNLLFVANNVTNLMNMTPQ